MRARAAALAIACCLLAACSAGSAPPPGALIVPAVWAGVTPSGELVGGMEPATVSVATVGEPGFSVNLADIQAEGAGPQWLAATSVAAAVGTLYSGVDPRTVDIGYTVTGPIDGPSAGAVLTVGTIAAIKGDPLLPGVTMTGTIAPDGSIGVVARVSTKIRSAAEAGYTKILIPFGTERESRGQGAEPLDLVALGSQLGIEVKVALDIGEAYADFTGVTLRSVAGVPELSPEVAALAARQAAALADMVRAEAPTSGATVDLPAIDAALEAGDSALAYGLALDALKEIRRARAEQDTRAQLAAEGLAAVQASLGEQIAELRAKAELAVQEGSAVQGLGLEQVISMAYALGWATTADAQLQSAGSFDSSADEGILVELSRVIADARCAIEVFGPDSVEIVRAASSAAIVDQGATVDFLSGYTNFLVTAGNSALAYYRTALPAYASGRPGDPEAAVQVLADEAASIPQQSNSLPEEVRQLATVVSFYLGGQGLVSGAAFGMTGAGIGEDPISGESKDLLTANAIASGSAAAFTWADRVQEGGTGIDYAIWQTQWGTELFAAMDGSPREDAAAVIALDEVWHAVVNSLMSRAAQDALRAPGVPSPAPSPGE